MELSMLEKGWDLKFYKVRFAHSHSPESDPSTTHKNAPTPRQQFARSGALLRFLRSQHFSAFWRGHAARRRGREMGMPIAKKYTPSGAASAKRGARGSRSTRRAG